MDVAWQALGPDAPSGEGTVLSSGELVVADWKEWRLVDPVAGTWRSMPSAAVSPGWYVTGLHPLPDGRVLVVGESKGVVRHTHVVRCAVVDLARQRVHQRACDEDQAGRTVVTSIPLPGGGAFAQEGAWAAWFDLHGRPRRALPPRALTGPALASLPDGGVLALDATGAAWRVDAEAWTPVAPLPAPRWRPAAVALPDGTVLVVGGGLGEDARDDTWRYDPAADTWTAGPALHMARSVPAATVAPDGTVWVAGGIDRTEHYVPFAEQWRPGAAGWTFGGSLPVGHEDGKLVVTPDGSVWKVDGDLWRAPEVPDGAPWPTGWERPRSDGLGWTRDGPKVGTRFPDLAWVDRDHVNHQLSGVAGARVVHLWATWCTACVGAPASLDQLAADLGPRGVTVLGLSTGPVGRRRPVRCGAPTPVNQQSGGDPR